MNFIKYISLFFFIESIIFFSCSPAKQTEEDPKDKEQTQLSTEKQKIKSFWDTYRIAQKYRVEGKWEDAVLYYEKALEIDNDHEDARFNLGNMYLELKQYEKAEKCWIDIVEVNPNSARSHMQLGRLYLSFERTETFDIDKAKNEFLKTFEINKVVTGPLMLLGHVALLKGEENVAKDYFKSVVGSDIKNVEAYFLLGYIEWKNGYLSKAQEIFNKAVTLSAPEKAIQGTLSEGDTKDGISYLRSLNESLFHEYFKDLFEIENKEAQMNERYNRMDLKLNNIRKTM
ncbi:MAG: tetratricopeptide repeat protein [Cyclobacteriaceae bacterium]|nr:tetratricopeptide repeat protein [Cyclobacteriaceae bacterium]